MYKLLLVIVLLGVQQTLGEESPNDLKDELNTARQKRLLFYDEEGNLVKTYSNPLRFDFSHNAEKSQLPLLGKFFGSLFNYFKPSSLGGPSAYMIPVSNEVVQQINSDPIYQNKLLTIPRKELVIAPSILCANKREQIPAQDCRNFLNCWDGWAVEQECPEGLMFSKEGYCDYAHNVDCGRRQKEPQPPLNLPLPVPQCTNEFETWRNELQCNEFFVCVDRTPVKFRCPADLRYNTQLGVCDYREKVACIAPPFDAALPAVPALPIAPIPSLPATQPSLPGTQPSLPGTLPSLPSAPIPIAPAKPGACETKDPIDSVIIAPGNEGVGFGSPGLGNGIISNAVFNTQRWSSSHVAISRLDAIRQLKGDISRA